MQKIMSNMRCSFITTVFSAVEAPNKEIEADIAKSRQRRLIWRYMQREVMKILIILLLFFSSTISAKDFCPINEYVAEDMRIEESAFNKANAEKSADYLLKIVKDENTPFEWFSIPSATKFIHGYALRRKALATNATKLTIDQFCDFYAKEGWYYD